MKRLMFLMCVLLAFVCAFSGTMIVANADEEVNSSGVVTANAIGVAKIATLHYTPSISKIDNKNNFLIYLLTN